MKYYIIVGEASGDMYGASLMRALKAKDPEAEFRYWGGDAMKSVEGEPVRHIRELAIMGFVEVVRLLGTVMANIRLCKHDIEQYAPDAIIYVDYPGFNMRIEKYAHKRGYLNIHYISPQLWAWKKGRIKKMRRDLDRLCYILPFEQKFYEDGKLPQAVYVGHPLLDVVERYRAANGEKSGNCEKVVALLPGSRKQELKRTMPLMMQLAKNYPDHRFEVAGMTLIGEEFYRNYTKGIDNVRVVYDQTYSLLSRSEGAVVCSGTATLETALFDVPQVVCYSGNPLSIAIARSLVSKRINYISLVNLIVDEPVVCELIQEDFNIVRLKEEFEKIINNQECRRRVMEGYERLHNMLGGSGASERTADEVMKLIAERR